MLDRGIRPIINPPARYAHMIKADDRWLHSASTEFYSRKTFFHKSPIKKTGEVTQAPTTSGLIWSSKPA